MSFSDVLGHDRQAEVLKRGITTGQMPPAYLFHGEEGIGKLKVALELAKAVNCTGGVGPGEPCGVCQPCRNVEAGCHPNVRVVGLEMNPDTKKMRQQIVMEQVHAAQDFLSLKAVGSGRKVLIVDGAHLMNESTANAFLKTLEEPPDNSHVILVTSRPDHLLATIRSRCRAVSFQPLREELVAGLLVDRKGMDEGEAAFVARMTGGRVGAALQEDAAALFERRESVLRVLSSLSDSGLTGALRDAEELYKGPVGLEDFVSFGTLWFRDLMLILVGAGQALTYNRDIAKELSDWASRTTVYRCELALGHLAGAGRALERTYNRRLLAEDLLISLKEDALAKPALI